MARVTFTVRNRLLTLNMERSPELKSNVALTELPVENALVMDLNNTLVDLNNALVMQSPRLS